MGTESLALDEMLASDEARRQTESAEGVTFRPGQTVGNYRVVAFLGRGAASEVWRVRDEALRTDFALKVFSGGDQAAKDSKSRFIAEARLLAQFNHRHLVRVHSLNEAGEHPYFTMDLLRPLPHMPDRRVLRRILDGVLSALEALHAKGVLHRDIKPSNILQDNDGNAVLTDLGIAQIGDETIADRILDAGARNLTISGGKVAALGTPGFGAPEQFDGGETTPASDIHALGVTLLTLCGGHPPLFYRQLILRMTSSSPLMRFSSVRGVRRFLRFARACGVVLRLVLVSAVLAGAALTVRNTIFRDAFIEWRELNPITDFENVVFDDERGFCTNDYKAITLRDGNYFTLPKEYRNGLRCSPYQWYVGGTKVRKRPKIVIRGNGTLNCPVITGAHVTIERGVTLITSGKFEKLDEKLRPTPLPPDDAMMDDPAYSGYAAFTVEPGGKLIFEDGLKYPAGLIEYLQEP